MPTIIVFLALGFPPSEQAVQGVRFSQEWN
jgi:hypothetical protein